MQKSHYFHFFISLTICFIFLFVSVTTDAFAKSKSSSSGQSKQSSGTSKSTGGSSKTGGGSTKAAPKSGTSAGGSSVNKGPSTPTRTATQQLRDAGFTVNGTGVSTRVGNIATYSDAKRAADAMANVANQRYSQGNMSYRSEVTRSANGSYTAAVAPVPGGSSGGTTGGGGLGGGGGTGTGGGGAQACTGNPNLIVSDVFFVPATGPATAAAAVTPQAGQQYRPVAVVTNNRCRATNAAGQFVSEGLIGSNGSFPVRLRLDFGRNNNYDYTEYLGNQGPLAGNRAATVVFPAVTIAAAGSHSMEGRVDAPASEAPGQGCSPATGCITESSETDNTRTETFAVTGNNNLPLTVDVNDITVTVGSTLNRVPFNVENDSVQTVNRIYYSIEINNLVVGDSSQAVVMAPNQAQNISGMVSYTAPNNPINLPLRVCAQADPASNPNCDTAQLRVITTQCADRADNDTDTFTDRNDVGCLTDPLDPTTYNANDNNENDISTSTTMIRIEFGPASPLVRYNEGTNLEYTIQAPRALTCTVSGGGLNRTVTYPGGAAVTGFVPSGNLQNTQSFTMKCDAAIQGYTISNERSTSVEVIPQAQEV